MRAFRIFLNPCFPCMAGQELILAFPGWELVEPRWGAGSVEIRFCSWADEIIPAITPSKGRVTQAGANPVANGELAAVCPHSAGFCLPARGTGTLVLQSVDHLSQVGQYWHVVVVLCKYLSSMYDFAARLV